MTPARGPGPVAAAHRLLIAAALACGLVFAVWEVREYGRTGRGSALLLAGAALLVSGGLGLYFRSLRTRLAAKLAPRG